MRAFLILAVLGRAWAALAYSNLQDSFHNEFRLQMLHSRQPAERKVVPPFFHSALGGAGPPPITDSGNPGRPYEVNGSTFVSRRLFLSARPGPTSPGAAATADNRPVAQPMFIDAAQRVCDNQHNTCAELANKHGASFSVSQCDQQSSESSPACHSLGFPTDRPEADAPRPFSAPGECKAAAAAASNTAFSVVPESSTPATPATTTSTNSAQPVLVSSNAQYDFYCDL